MKLEIKKVAIFYSISIFLITLNTLAMEQPRHFPGLNYMMGALTIIVGVIWFLKNLFSLLKDPELRNNSGAIIIHLLIFSIVIIWFYYL